MTRPMLMLLAALSPLSAQAETVIRVTGQAVDLDSGKPIYREIHEQRYAGTRWLSGRIRYVAEDGRLLGEKTLDFSRDPYVPLMRFQQPLTGSVDSVTAVDARGIRLETRDDGKRSSRVLARAPEQVADAGFSAYISDHLPALASGKTLQLRFIAVARLDQYRFRIIPGERVTLDGEPAITLRVEPDSLLRLVAPSLRVVYGLESRRLLSYEGLSNLTNPETGKLWDARIRFGPVERVADGASPVTSASAPNPR